MHGEPSEHRDGNEPPKPPYRMASHANRASASGAVTAALLKPVTPTLAPRIARAETTPAQSLDRPQL